MHSYLVGLKVFILDSASLIPSLFVRAAKAFVQSRLSHAISTKFPLPSVSVVLDLVMTR